VSDLENHVEVCSVRYEQIHENIESVRNRIDRLEMIVIAQFPFIVSVILGAEFLN
jgi:chaperonin cofactor prefoldin